MEKINLIEDGTFAFPDAEFNFNGNSVSNKDLTFIGAAQSTKSRWDINSTGTYETICGYDSIKARLDADWQKFYPKSNAVRLSGAEGNPLGAIKQVIKFTRPGACTITFWARSNFYDPTTPAVSSQLQVQLDDTHLSSLRCDQTWRRHEISFAGVDLPQKVESISHSLKFSCGNGVVSPYAPTLRNVEMSYNELPVVALMPERKKQIPYFPGAIVGRQQFLIRDTAGQRLPGAWVEFRFTAESEGIFFADGKNSLHIQCDENSVVTLSAGALHATHDITGMLVVSIGGNDISQFSFVKRDTSEARIRLNTDNPLNVFPRSAMAEVAAQYESYPFAPEMMNFSIEPSGVTGGLLINGKTQGTLISHYNRFILPSLKMGSSKNIDQYVITLSDPDGEASKAILTVNVIAKDQLTFTLHPRDMGSKGTQQNVEPSDTQSILGEAERDWYVQVSSTHSPFKAIEGVPLEFDIIRTDPLVEVNFTHDSDIISGFTDRDGKLRLPPVKTHYIQGRFSLRVSYRGKEVDKFKFLIKSSDEIRAIEFSDYEISLKVNDGETNGWDHAIAYTNVMKTDVAHHGEITLYINNEGKTNAKWESNASEVIKAGIGLRGVVYFPALSPGMTTGNISIDASAGISRATKPKSYLIKP